MRLSGALGFRRSVLGLKSVLWLPISNTLHLKEFLNNNFVHNTKFRTNRMDSQFNKFVGSDFIQSYFTTLGISHN